MSWWNNLENNVGSWFNKQTQPSSAPNDAPLKSLMKSAPSSSGTTFDDNAKMKQQLLDGSFKKGGPVKKTGNYKLHKGEYVLNEKKTKMAKKMKRR